MLSRPLHLVRRGATCEGGVSATSPRTVHTLPDHAQADWGADVRREWHANTMCHRKTRPTNIHALFIYWESFRNKSSAGFRKLGSTECRGKKKTVIAESNQNIRIIFVMLKVSQSPNLKDWLSAEFTRNICLMPVTLEMHQ